MEKHKFLYSIEKKKKKCNNHKNYVKKVKV